LVLVSIAIFSSLNLILTTTPGAGGVLRRAESIAFAKTLATLALIDIPPATESVEQTKKECEDEGAVVKTSFAML
jgi:hypothetical protein